MTRQSEVQEREWELRVTVFDVFPTGGWHLSSDERTAAVERARMRQRRRIRRRARRAKWRLTV
jgi:CRISPR/Cas system CSM-associated protein Csm3 (group 7 of RAMP superfamily)